MELQSSRLPTAGCMFIRLYLFSTSLGMGRLGSVKDRSLESMREKYIEKIILYCPNFVLQEEVEQLGSVSTISFLCRNNWLLEEIGPQFLGQGTIAPTQRSSIASCNELKPRMS